jgi:hypothetical protein
VRTTCSQGRLCERTTVEFVSYNELGLNIDRSFYSATRDRLADRQTSVGIDDAVANRLVLYT